MMVIHVAKNNKNKKQPFGNRWYEFLGMVFLHGLPHVAECWQESPRFFVDVDSTSDSWPFFQKQKLQLVVLIQQKKKNNDTR